jgi:hypothetical protein
MIGDVFDPCENVLDFGLFQGRTPPGRHVTKALIAMDMRKLFQTPVRLPSYDFPPTTFLLAVDDFSFMQG